MNRCMNGVDFDGGRNVKARLFKTQAHTTSAGEKIDSDWTRHIAPSAYRIAVSKRTAGPSALAKKILEASKKTIRILGLTLPDCEYAPSCRFKASNRFGISGSISLDLAGPKTKSAFWQASL
jgi:hypothetical protein